MHDVCGRQAAQIDAFLNQAAQIAVGKNTQHAPLLIHDGRSAQALGTHLAHQGAEVRRWRHRGDGVALAHDVAHMREQATAQGAARMGAGKVFGLEAARIEQSHGQGIAQGQLGRGAGGGRQIQGAGLFGHTAVQHNVGVMGQGGVQAACDGNQGNAQALEHRQNGGQFIALAAVGQGQHQVLGLHHAQIAMAGLGRMHEQRRGSGGSQRGRHLAANVAAFAHAHHHHPALHRQHALHRMHKTFRQALPDLLHRRGFDVQRFSGQLKNALALVGGQALASVRGKRGVHPLIL